ncbi:MAG: hypothetical protein LE180_03335 [Endomicrobium sp.]|nr:hypothetical protein [Endomicrobium sp.]
MANLLSIMLNVGLDFYGVAGKVIQAIDGPLADEFKNVLSKFLLEGR